jgi:hypothetical protein
MTVLYKLPLLTSNSQLLTADCDHSFFPLALVIRPWCRPHRKHNFQQFLCYCVLIFLLQNSTAVSVPPASVPVAAETCSLCHCLANTASTHSTIPAFSHHVTLLLPPKGQHKIWNVMPWHLVEFTGVSLEYATSIFSLGVCVCTVSLYSSQVCLSWSFCHLGQKPTEIILSLVVGPLNSERPQKVSPSWPELLWEAYMLEQCFPNGIKCNPKVLQSGNKASMRKRH